MHVKGSLSDDQRSAIVDAARECVGTRFHFNERKPGHAIDCVGVVRYAMQRVGLYCPPDIHYSSRTCFGEPTYLESRSGMDEIPMDAIGIGSVVLLWARERHQPQHMGIWTGDTLVHAHMRARRVIETPGQLQSVNVFAGFDMRQTAEPAHRVEGYNGPPRKDWRAWRTWCNGRVQ